MSKTPEQQALADIEVLIKVIKENFKKIGDIAEKYGLEDVSFGGEDFPDMTLYSKKILATKMDQVREENKVEIQRLIDEEGYDEDDIQEWLREEADIYLPEYFDYSENDRAWLTSSDMC